MNAGYTPMPDDRTGVCESQPTGSPSTNSDPRIIDSAELLLGQSLLLIRHLGEIYRLQTTRQGKLILTK